MSIFMLNSWMSRCQGPLHSVDHVKGDDRPPIAMAHDERRLKELFRDLEENRLVRKSFH